MTLELPLSPELASKLQEQAQAAGMDVTEFVREILEERLAAEAPMGQAVPRATKQRLSEFRKWIASHKPLPYEADDSRESIYEGRGEMRAS